MALDLAAVKHAHSTKCLRYYDDAFHKLAGVENKDKAVLKAYSKAYPVEQYVKKMFATENEAVEGAHVL